MNLGLIESGSERETIAHARCTIYAISTSEHDYSRSKLKYLHPRYVCARGPRPCSGMEITRLLHNHTGEVMHSMLSKKLTNKEIKKKLKV